MGKVFRVVILVFFTCILASCSIFHRDGDSNSEKAQIAHNISVLNKKLSKYSVRIFQSVNSIKLVLPNKVFFTKNSANFTGDAYEALDLVFGLSNYMKVSSIAVTGYSKNNNDNFSMTLAIERARRIMQHLQSFRIEGNFMYADGKGGTFIDNKISISDCVLIEFKDF